MLQAHPKSATPSITFQLESFEPMLVSGSADLQILDRLHGEHTQGDRPRGYDYDSYVRLERAGQYKIWVARDDGASIGFVSYFIRFNPHYGPGWKTGLHDLWYVDPPYRSGFVPMTLWRAAEYGLRALGVRSIMHGMSAKHDHAAVLERAGYRKIETVYEKVIK